MSLESLKKNVRAKSAIKESYMQGIRGINRDLSTTAESSILDVTGILLSGLEVGDNLIKNSSNNKQVSRGASVLYERAIDNYHSEMDKALIAIGIVAEEVHKDLKGADEVYLGKDRYAPFSRIPDSVLEDVGTFHDSGLKKNAANMKTANQYFKDTVRNAILFNLPVSVLSGQLINDANHVKVNQSSLYSMSLGNLNNHSGNILNFYTEIPRTVEAGIRNVYNSNPMDERTKPICAAATLAGIIPISKMRGAYGTPPRGLCRCDLVWLKPEWKDVEADIEALIAEQKTTWKEKLLKQPRRKDGKYFSDVNKQLQVLEKKHTPVKFKQTALHTSKMRLMSKSQVQDIITTYKSTYAQKYGATVPKVLPPTVQKITPLSKQTGALSNSERIDNAYTKLASIEMYDVDFQSAKPTMAEAITNGLVDIKNKGYKLPAKIRVPDKDTWNSMARRGRLPVTNTLAFHNPSENTLVFNAHVRKASRWWDRPIKSKYNKGLLGWHSSDHPSQVVYHEVGHVNHNADMQTRRWTFLSKDRKMITEKVGRYATTNREEFVAEVFAGSLSGIKYDREIMDLYYSFKGPRI